jgi:hypothetical protein
VVVHPLPKLQLKFVGFWGKVPDRAGGGRRELSKEGFVCRVKTLTFKKEKKP